MRREQKINKNETPAGRPGRGLKRESGPPGENRRRGVKDGLSPSKIHPEIFPRQSLRPSPDLKDGFRNRPGLLFPGYSRADSLLRASHPGKPAARTYTRRDANLLLPHPRTPFPGDNPGRLGLLDPRPTLMGLFPRIFPGPRHYL